MLTTEPMNGELGIDDLRELIEAFNQTTVRLQRTHTDLQREVTRLRRELAEANEQLERSRSLASLGQMAAGIAHEVRNPLGSIQLYAQMLGDDLGDRPEQAAVCDKIRQAVFGLDAIVRDVLQFARQTRVRPAATTADDLFDRALITCEAQIEQDSVRLERDAVEPCPLTVDVALMTQALGNVIRNGVEAMHEHGGGTLTLAAGTRRVRCPDGRRASRVVLAVADEGPGIDEDARQRMFNPFFTTRATGTGLGLAIVHRIVDAHGGHINVLNRDEAGACVELCLPSRRRSAAGEAERA
ncbi:MAG: sensor histidine kinase, partial [Planctomycetota bacterium]